jgi:hypothetical protein
MVRGVVFTEYLRAAVVTVMAGTVALWAAIRLSSRRES